MHLFVYPPQAHSLVLNAEASSCHPSPSFLPRQNRKYTQPAKKSPANIKRLSQRDYSSSPVKIERRRAYTCVRARVAGLERVKSSRERALALSQNASRNTWHHFSPRAWNVCVSVVVASFSRSEESRSKVDTGASVLSRSLVLRGVSACSFFR